MTTTSTKARGLMLPEGQMIARAASGVSEWVPTNANDAHAQIVTIAAALTMLGDAVLTYGETLAAMGCDPRVVDNIAGAAERLGQGAGDLSRADQWFVSLYAGDIAQAESPARQMTYGPVKR